MTLDAGRWYTFFELVDTGGKKTTRRFEQSAPADDTAARAAALALATDLAAVTDCTISKYFSYQVFEETSFALPSGAELEMQAVVSMTIDSEPFKSGMVTIPAPKASIFVDTSGPNYDVVDTTDADLVAFMANWVTEDLYYVSDGEQADAVLGGFRRHTKSRRG